MLNLIEEKITNKKRLSFEELNYLYEYNSDNKDKKNELIKKRNIKKDLSNLYNCNEKQVCLQHQLTYNDDCYVYYGNMNFITLRFAYDMKFPKIIIGNLNLKQLKKATNIIFPEEIKGNLYLQSLIGIKDCILPKVVKGNLFINSFEELDNLVLPDSIEGKIITFYGLFDTKKDLEKYIETVYNQKSITEKKR